MKNINVGPYSKQQLQFGAFGENLSVLPERGMWKLGPFDDSETAVAAIRLCWGAYGSEERKRKGIGLCHVDYYHRPERYKNAKPWPGVT